MASIPPALLQTTKSIRRVFHDVEYTIRINVDENGLNIEVENAGNCESHMWRSHFPHSFIEEISRRAGNAKSFPVFLKMLVSALEEESSSVYLDLLTARDLEMLRQRQDLKPPNVKDSSNKRYLILTYQAEFDKVHYPLALQPVEMETTDNLRGMIQQLRKQLERGAHTEELERLRKENEQLRAELRDAELHAIDAERVRGPDRRESAELSHIRQSLSKYQNELKILRDAKQRLVIDHRKECEQLRKEFLQSKSEVRRLEAQLRREASRRGTSPTGRSVRSRPLSASSASSASSYGSNRSATRAPSSRHHRTNPATINRSVASSLHPSSRISPASSLTSFGRSPRTNDLPPRRRLSPSRDFIPDTNTRRSSPSTRRPADVARRSSPGAGVPRPPSNRHTRQFDQSLSPATRDRVNRPPSRSLSPSMRTYVSPYAQNARPPRIPSPQPVRRATPEGLPQKPTSMRTASPARHSHARVASPQVQMRTGAEISPIEVSDLDARLTALQNFLRNNQTMVES
eukprot:GEMP01019126.1.p1 GENE.GEMP01019126.1~~GEMP01019126.1.p1  ORF type:complete len:517 (+),score=108.71 GEMP01019126.1:95-1645(+)